MPSQIAYRKRKIRDLDDAEGLPPGDTDAMASDNPLPTTALYQATISTTLPIGTQGSTLHSCDTQAQNSRLKNLIQSQKLWALNMEASPSTRHASQPIAEGIKLRPNTSPSVKFPASSPVAPALPRRRPRPRPRPSSSRLKENPLVAVLGTTPKHLHPRSSRHIVSHPSPSTNYIVLPHTAPDAFPLEPKTPNPNIQPKHSRNHASRVSSVLSTLPNSDSDSLGLDSSSPLSKKSLEAIKSVRSVVHASPQRTVPASMIPCLVDTRKPAYTYISQADISIPSIALLSPALPSRLYPSAAPLPTSRKQPSKAVISTQQRFPGKTPSINNPSLQEETEFSLSPFMPLSSSTPRSLQRTLSQVEDGTLSMDIDPSDQLSPRISSFFHSVQPSAEDTILISDAGANSSHQPGAYEQTSGRGDSCYTKDSIFSSIGNTTLSPTSKLPNCQEGHDYSWSDLDKSRAHRNSNVLSAQRALSSTSSMSLVSTVAGTTAITTSFFHSPNTASTLSISSLKQSSQPIDEPGHSNSEIEDLAFNVGLPSRGSLLNTKSLPTTIISGKATAEAETISSRVLPTATVGPSQTTTLIAGGSISDAQRYQPNIAANSWPPKLSSKTSASARERPPKRVSFASGTRGGTPSTTEHMYQISPVLSLEMPPSTPPSQITRSARPKVINTPYADVSRPAEVSTSQPLSSPDPLDIISPIKEDQPPEYSRRPSRWKPLLRRAPTPSDESSGDELLLRVRPQVVVVWVD